MDIRYPMKKNGSINANAKVAKNTVRKMFNIPFWAYRVQMPTTFLESDTDALSLLSSLMLALINSTARYAPVVTAWMLAPVNQKMTAPPEMRPNRKGACIRDSFSMFIV